MQSPPQPALCNTTTAAAAKAPQWPALERWGRGAPWTEERVPPGWWALGWWSRGGLVTGRPTPGSCWCRWSSSHAHCGCGGQTATPTPATPPLHYRNTYINTGRLDIRQFTLTVIPPVSRWLLSTICHYPDIPPESTKVIRSNLTLPQGSWVTVPPLPTWWCCDFICDFLFSIYIYKFLICCSIYIIIWFLCIVPSFSFKMRGNKKKP